MTELHEHRLKRMKMRSMRRGIKEMDILLGGFAATELDALSKSDLEIYEKILNENDQDLYQWVSNQVAGPAEYQDLFDRITKFRAESVR